MANKPLFSIDIPTLKKGLRDVQHNLQVTEDRLVSAISASMVQFTEHVIGIAQQRAPIKHGFLRASATVVGPEIIDRQIVLVGGFNIKYARIQELGGIIRPRPPRRFLFIPLTDSARPGDPALTFGVDFVLARQVYIKPKLYLTRTVRELRLGAAKAIGARAFQILMAQAG